MVLQLEAWRKVQGPRVRMVVVVLGRQGQAVLEQVLTQAKGLKLPS